MLRSVRSALALVDRRSRRLLLLLVVVQVLLAFLDLLGIAMLGLVAALATAAVSGQEPALVSQVVDRLNLEDASLMNLAAGLAVAAGIVLITKSIFSFVLVRKSFRFLANRQAMISGRLAEQLLSRPLLDVQRRPSQETGYALTIGVNAATLGVLGGAVVGVGEIAVLVVVAAGLLALAPVVAMFSVLFFASVGYGLNRVLGNWARRLGSQQAETEIESLTSVQNTLRSYREIGVTGRRALIVDQFKGLRWHAAQVQSDLQVMGQVSKYTFEIALVIGAGVLAISQLLTREVSAAVAIIAVFLVAASRITPSMLRLQQAALSIRTSRGIAASTFALNDELSHDDYRTEPVQGLAERVVAGARSGYQGFAGTVRIDAVTLRYPGADSAALLDVSLEVAEGDSLALVGPTGAGKSTLADVILGVLQPDFGKVSVSGVDPNQAMSRWPGVAGYVPQDIVVVSGTIRENVALGIPPEFVDDALVWEALQRAHLSEVVQGRSEGLGAVVGEHGVRLSGGQRQRLGLARALYTRPRLLVLDEATSALDAETEHMIGTALQELRGSVTLIIVAHRLATIRTCTQVAYIEDGRLAALGTFDEVRRAQPRFDKQARLLGL